MRDFLDAWTMPVVLMLTLVLAVYFVTAAQHAAKPQFRVKSLEERVLDLESRVAEIESRV